MSFSMAKMMEQDDPAFLRKVSRRTIIIFVIALFLAACPFFRMVDGEAIAFDFSRIRIMGVLQRIALCYALAALVIYYLKGKGAIIFSFLTLIGYWAVMYFFGDEGDPYSLTGNAALKLDLLLIGPDNMYRGGRDPL